tara:strand:- start:338 stop:598 length:261 start_codon:yes stop_codon:yes gene_type:complete
MTEQDLIDLGFNKITVTDEESNNGYDYYYYSLTLMEGLSLDSNDSDHTTTHGWEVKNYDWPTTKSISKESIILLAQMAQDLQDLNP